MKFLLVLLCLPFLMGMNSCSAPKYSDDTGMIPSAIANSPELPLWVNGKLCRDNDGVYGLCAVRLKRNEDFLVTLMPQQYAYDLEWDCTRSVQPQTERYTIPKNEGFIATVSKAMYGQARVFVCTARISPLDRPEPISTFARVYVSLVDDRYQRMEDPHQIGHYFVFGSHARYSRWWDGAKWYEEFEKTAMKSDDVQLSISESYSGRVSVYQK